MSRYRRNTIFLLILIVIIAISVFDRITKTNNDSKISLENTDIKTNDFEKYHGQKFLVINVVDGDTIDIDIGDGKFRHTRIRLLGVDTPETEHSPKGKMYFGPEAKEFVTNLAAGKIITVYLDENGRSRDKYNRLLAYIQLGDRSFLNELLLSEGYAYADVRFKHRFYYSYMELEAVARSLNKGLWKDVKFDQLPEWLQREKPQLLSK